MSGLPRELHLWLTSLNLSYKIVNPKRDLSNGYVFAEIFNRYFPDKIEMYTVDNGIKLAIKQNNWEFLQRFFNKNKIPIGFDDYDPVMHMAPGAAYNLLLKVYSILNDGKEVAETVKPTGIEFEEETPDYAKPTISAKVKDHEIQRVADEKTKNDMATTMMTDHNDMLRTNRLNRSKMGFPKARLTQMANAKALSQLKRKSKISERDGASQHEMNRTENEDQNISPENVKEVQVKTANKSIRIMRQEAAAKKDPTQAFQDLDDSDDMKLESVLIDILSKNIDSKMSKGDPEYKIFKENYHRILSYFTERLKHIPDDLLHEIFSELNDRVDEFVAILSKNLCEFCDLSEFICKCLAELNPLNVVESVESSKTKNIFLLVVETLATIGNKL